MVEGIFNNAASLTALERWQSTIAQNLSSVNVAGFKKSDFAIKADENKNLKYQPDGVSAANHTGCIPTRLTSLNFAPGDIKATGKNTDFAIEGDGFFQVQGPNGQNLYTRNGEFHLNADNTLVNNDGLQVLVDGGPVTINPDLGPFSVARNGTISQDGTQLGRISLYQFEDTKKLTRVEGGYFEPSEGAAPQNVENPLIVQGSIETSNVVPMAELVNLVAVSRAYEASQRVMTSHDDLISKAINSLGATA